MTSITTCQILNEYNKELITLCTEWLDSSFKIIILTSTMTPLIGEVTPMEIENFARTFDWSCQQYLQETKDMLSGKDSNVEFNLLESKQEFKWRREMWNYGIVKVHALSEMKNLSSFLQKLLEQYSCVEQELFGLRKENEDLKDARKELTEKLDDTISMKNIIEEELYKRFIVILNSKKKRIRELEEDLKKKAKESASVYNAYTDDSHSSNDEANTSSRKLDGENEVEKRQKKLRKLRRGSSTSENNADIDVASGKKRLKKDNGRSHDWADESCFINKGSIKKEDRTISHEGKECGLGSPKASTSKCFGNESWDNIPETSGIRVDTYKSEMEEGNELKREPKSIVNKFNFIEEESEDDLFL